MSSFTIYTYQFAPISDYIGQYSSLFPENDVSVESVLMGKQQAFQSLSYDCTFTPQLPEGCDLEEERILLHCCCARVADHSVSSPPDQHYYYCCCRLRRLRWNNCSPRLPLTNYLSDDDETFSFSFLFLFLFLLSSSEDVLRISPSHSRIYSELTRAVMTYN